jgi:hypothetical protein
MVREFQRAAEGDTVSGVDLIRCETQTLARDAAKERGWKETVVATEKESGRHVGPRFEGPRFPRRRCGLGPRPLPRLGRQFGRNVVVEESDVIVVVLAHLPLVSGVRPPILRSLSGGRDQARDQDEEARRSAFADERSCEGAERLRHDDEVGSLADRVDHCVPAYRARPAESSSHGRSGATVS